MAFYHDMPENKNRERRARQNAGWEEEGSRYSGADRRGGRKSYRAEDRNGQDDFRGKSYSGFRSSDRSGGYQPGNWNGQRSDDRDQRHGDRNRGRNEDRFGDRTRRYEDEPVSRGVNRRDQNDFAGRDRSPRGEDYHRERPHGKEKYGRNRTASPAEYGFSRPADDFRDEWEEKPAKSFQDFEYHSPVVTAEPDKDQQPDTEFILTGRNPIREALRSDRDLEKLLVQKGELSGSAREIVAVAKEKKIMVQVVEKSRLDEIAPHHQGLIAIASAYQYAAMEELYETARERNEDPFFIVLDGITDPHNLGAIIRTAECAGAHGVIVPQHRSVGLTPAAVKASAGAVEHLKVARVTNINRTIEEMQKKGIWVYGLSMEGEDYENVRFQGGTALVIGAEGEGISRLTADKCDQVISLPIRGKIDSLNASVAAGIMMYRVLSSRKKNG